MTKKFVKAALIASCALVLMVATIAGTLAYLTDKTEAISNTFTSGKVKITLDNEVDAGVNVNEYKLLPGKKYDYKPVVTVVADSEACYLFVKVVNNIAALEESGNTTIAKQLESNEWTLLSGDVYSYNSIVTSSNANQKVNVFSNFTISETADNKNFENIATKTIEITAYAIQADGFNNATEAWAAAPADWKS